MLADDGCSRREGLRKNNSSGLDPGSLAGCTGTGSGSEASGRDICVPNIVCAICM